MRAPRFKIATLMHVIAVSAYAFALFRLEGFSAAFASLLYLLYIATGGVIRIVRERSDGAATSANDVQ